MILALLALAAGIHEDFSRGMSDWWTEGGAGVRVEGGRLRVSADNPAVPGGGVATVWHRARHGDDFTIDVDAHVVSSSLQANNINLFLSYTDPSGAGLEESRDARRLAEYPFYHRLRGYIITFLNDTEAGHGMARVRIRRNPGFGLLAETYAYHCRAGRTYHLHVSKRGGAIRFSVDGKELLTAVDPEPLPGGWFGLRTFRTDLWWDNVRLE